VSVESRFVILLSEGHCQSWGALATLTRTVLRIGTPSPRIDLFLGLRRGNHVTCLLFINDTLFWACDHTFYTTHPILTPALPPLTNKALQRHMPESYLNLATLTVDRPIHRGSHRPTLQARWCITACRMITITSERCSTSIQHLLHSYASFSANRHSETTS
jgi:hypothetical protein